GSTVSRLISKRIWSDSESGRPSPEMAPSARLSAPGWPPAGEMALGVPVAGVAAGAAAGAAGVGAGAVAAGAGAGWARAGPGRRGRSPAGRGARARASPRRGPPPAGSIWRASECRRRSSFAALGSRNRTFGGDNLDDADAEAPVHGHHLAAGDQGAVRHDVEHLVRLAVQLDDAALGEIHELRQPERGAADFDRQTDGDVGEQPEIAAGEGGVGRGGAEPLAPVAGAHPAIVLGARGELGLDRPQGGDGIKDFDARAGTGPGRDLEAGDRHRLVGAGEVSEADIGLAALELGTDGHDF